ncbi:MAG: UDP-N-acetylmuramoyl-L-alanine--D-glutamate ligase [Kiritimatiellales bacterium]
MHTYKKALVIGCGRSGRAAEALLRSEHCLVRSICEEITPDYSYEDLHYDPEVAIVSPGVPLTHPWIKDLVERGIPLLSEIELGWSRRHCPVIAVTGSNGKSTVVKWIVEALACSGLRAVPCGNYGFPVCAAVLTPTVPDWLVMEVSSFQLETIREFRPDIGVLLNVLPNHLDRHGSMQAYRDLKLRLFENMQVTDTAVVPAEIFQTLEKNAENLPIIGKDSGTVSRHWKTFGIDEGADFWFHEGRVGTIDLSGTWFDNDILGLSAAAVAAVGAACGLPNEAVERSARQFEPLPHRMQVVAEMNGVTFIDDSKATNLAAMRAALKMCSGKVHLIAGGRSKESDFSFAKDLLVRQVSRLYLIGEASPQMQSAWQDSVECLPCGTLEKAVGAAWERAEPGDTVLLSPACTSFDQFRSFGERGDCFKAAVCRLDGGGAE